MPRKGFTLMELILTVIIIGILVSIAIPTYLTTVERARAREAKATLMSMHAAEQTYAAERRDYIDLPTSPASDINWEIVGMENPNNNTNRSWDFEYSAASRSGKAERISGPNVFESITIDSTGTIDESNWTPNP